MWIGVQADSSSANHWWVASSGEITFTTIGDGSGSAFAGSLRNVEFRHVTTDGTNAPTNVTADSCTTTIGSAAFDVPVGVLM